MKIASIKHKPNFLDFIVLIHRLIKLCIYANWARGRPIKSVERESVPKISNRRHVQVTHELSRRLHYDHESK